MRVAILLSGIAENVNTHLIDDWKAAFAGAELTFYASTWSDLPHSEFLQKLHVVDYEKFSDVEPILSQDKLNKAWFIDVKKVNNTLAMWYKWHKLKSIINSSKYDILVKTRFDVDFGGHVLDLAPWLESKALPGDLIIPAGGDSRGGVNDLVAIGNPENIIKYLDLYSLRHRLYKISGIMHPEINLRTYLVNVCGMRIFRLRHPLFLRGVPYTNFYNDSYLDQSSYEADPFTKRVLYQAQRRNFRDKLGLRWAKFKS